jgi:formate dehydrogenase major subunit
MEKAGTPVSRWYELVNMDKSEIEQPDNLRAMVFWGHSINRSRVCRSTTRP